MTTEPAIDLSGMKNRDCLAVPFLPVTLLFALIASLSMLARLIVFLLYGPEPRSSLAAEAAPGQFVFLMPTLSCI